MSKYSTKNIYSNYLQIVLIIYGFVFLVTMYLYFTTSALQEDFIQPIHDFALLFSEFVFVLHIGLFILLLLLPNASTFRIYAKAIALTTVGCIVLLQLIGMFFPCLLNEQVARTDLFTTLKKSYLCPSYSPRTLGTAIFIFIVGSATFFLAWLQTRKQKLHGNGSSLIDN